MAPPSFRARVEGPIQCCWSAPTQASTVVHMTRRAFDMLCGLQVLAHVDAVGVPLEEAVSAVSRAGADTVAFLEGLLERLASGGERRRVKIAKVLGNPMLFHDPEGVLQYRSNHGKRPLPLSISYATVH
jgi:hypothetical protein